MAGFPAGQGVLAPGVINQLSKFFPWSDATDIVTGVLGPDADHVIQVQFAGNDDLWGRYSRKITMGLIPNKGANPLANTRPLPDGSWTMLWNMNLQGVRPEMLLAKLPPLPALDSINRGDFIPIALPLGSVPPGTNNVIVEFGYNPNLYCTDRQEVCVANAPSIQPGNSVFSYSVSDSPSGLACTSGCTVTLPALSQRIMWYRVKYRDAQNALIATGRTEVVATP